MCTLYVEHANVKTLYPLNELWILYFMLIILLLPNITFHCSIPKYDFAKHSFPECYIAIFREQKCFYSSLSSIINAFSSLRVRNREKITTWKLNIWILKCNKPLCLSNYDICELRICRIMNWYLMTTKPNN